MGSELKRAMGALGRACVLALLAGCGGNVNNTGGTMNVAGGAAAAGVSSVGGAGGLSGSSGVIGAGGHSIGGNQSSSTGGVASAGASCMYGGADYPVGTTFAATDGCNTCTCNNPIDIRCTTVECDGGCRYEGKLYELGAEFADVDGCNTCSCTANGVSCTTRACQCNPDTEWWRSYSATDPGQCKTTAVSCNAVTVPFTNSCGCGCEQSKSCPRVFDCMAGCPSNEERAKCPFTRQLDLAH